MSTPTLLRSPMALATALILSAMAYPALAQGATPATDPAADKVAVADKVHAQDQGIMKLPKEGYRAMRSVREARIAIFNGNPQGASDALGKARASLDAAAKDAPVLEVDDRTGINGKIVEDTKTVEKLDAIPIDGQVVLADSFTDRPAKNAHIDKANTNIAKGRGKAAADELRLAEVDASFARVLMPLQVTTKHVDEANKLLGEQKQVEANLALKAAEDGLRFDSLVLSHAPAAGDAAKTRQ